MSKKVLILSGSPRKGGNSDLLCDEFMRGAQEAGNEVEKIRVVSKKIAPCSACYFCRSHHGEFRFVRFCADRCGNGADRRAEQGCSLLHQHAGAAQEVRADGAAGRRAEVNRFPSLTGCFGSPFFFPCLAQKS